MHSHKTLFKTESRERKDSIRGGGLILWVQGSLGLPLAAEVATSWFDSFLISGEGTATLNGLVQQRGLGLIPFNSA